MIVLDMHVWVWWLLEADWFLRRVVATVERERAAGQGTKGTSSSFWMTR